ncbi:MAG: hypothetical protein K1X74_00300 [Pirellulales bacterium]|nr:hypothetical protein [Pirellulales bacterium]
MASEVKQEAENIRQELESAEAGPGYITLIGLFSLALVPLQVLSELIRVMSANDLVSPLILRWITIPLLGILLFALLLRWLRIGRYVDVVRWFRRHNAALALLASFLLIIVTVLLFTLAIHLDRTAFYHRTECLGDFPANIDALNKFVAGTESRLDVLIDFPAYGILSDPVGARALKQSLVSLPKGIDKKNVRLLCFDRATATDAMKAGFDSVNKATASDDENFRRVKELPGYGEYLGSLEDPPETISELIENLQEIEERFVETYQAAGVNVRRLGSRRAMFVWIRDGKEAMFSFSVGGRNSREVAFHTIDGALVGAIQAMFDDEYGLAGERESQRKQAKHRDPE